MANEYEVLNPWAEVDPIPTRGISPRISDMNGKKIGLFRNSKVAARPMLEIVAEKIKERYPTVTFTNFVLLPNYSVAETSEQAKYEEWLKGVDAVIFSHGD